MATVKNGGVRLKDSTVWNIEKIGQRLYKFEAGSSTKAKIFFGDVEISIYKYYLQLPDNLTNKEINYIITQLSPNELITNAAMCIDYCTKFENIRLECEKISIIRLREEYYKSETDKLMEEFDDKIELITETNSIIAPYNWQIVPILDTTTLDGAVIPVNRGERIFILQVV